MKATARTASRALSFVKGAASLINAEIKHVDVSQSYSISTTATLAYLSGIAQGDGNTSRDGNSVKLKGGIIRLFIARNASATLSRVRIITFCDTRNQGTAPTATDVVDTAVTCNGLINIDSEPNRFVIINDSIVAVDDGGGLQKHLTIDMTPAINDMHLMFSGTGATVTSARGPVLYTLLLSNEATNTVGVAFDARVLFVDN